MLYKHCDGVLETLHEFIKSFVTKLVNGTSDMWMDESVDLKRYLLN
jgi:hypothetical protein